MLETMLKLIIMAGTTVVVLGSILLGAYYLAVYIRKKSEAFKNRLWL
jgi:hypothetical protein